MKDCIKCGICCLGIGMVVGGIVVAKNKKLASKINEYSSKAEQKFYEVKDDVEDKIDQTKQKIEEMQEDKQQKEQAEIEDALNTVSKMQSAKSKKNKN